MGCTQPRNAPPTRRFIGIFWGYDGTPSLCAPPRLYNQITTEISKRETNVMRLARLYALVNVVDGRCRHRVLGIEVLLGLLASRDRHPRVRSRHRTRPASATATTRRSATRRFWPLGAPASNLNGVDFTPPFPSYPSGHATFGGALFQTLRNFYGTDNIPFTFVSDEFNGETRASDGTVRPYMPRTFKRLSQAEEENGQSRIYLGIHWSFDKTEGIRQGRRIANYVFTHKFRPVR